MVITINLAQSDINVAQAHMVSVAVPGENRGEVLRIYPDAVVLDPDFCVSAVVPGSDTDMPGAFLRFESVAHSVFHQRLQTQEGDDGTENLGGNLEVYLDPVTEARPFQQ